MRVPFCYSGASLAVFGAVALLASCGGDKAAPTGGSVLSIRDGADQPMLEFGLGSEGWRLTRAAGALTSALSDSEVPTFDEGQSTGNGNSDEHSGGSGSGGGSESGGGAVPGLPSADDAPAGSRFSGAVARPTHFHGGLAPAGARSGALAHPGSFSGRAAAISTFAASLSSPLVGLTCDAGVLCDFAEQLCSGLESGGDCGDLSECRSAISQIVVPADLAPLVCAVIDYLACALNAAGSLSPTSSEAAASIAGTCAGQLEAVAAYGYEMSQPGGD